MSSGRKKQPNGPVWWRGGEKPLGSAKALQISSRHPCTLRSWRSVNLAGWSSQYETITDNGSRASGLLFVIENERPWQLLCKAESRASTTKVVIIYMRKYSRVDKHPASHPDNHSSCLQPQMLFFSRSFLNSLCLLLQLKLLFNKSTSISTDVKRNGGQSFTLCSIHRKCLSSTVAPPSSSHHCCKQSRSKLGGC